MTTHTASASTAPEQEQAVTRRWPTFRKPQWFFDDGALVYVKWLAIISMLVDHLNVMIGHPLGMYTPEAFYFGRLAAPLFAIMVGYNLARPDTSRTTRQSRARRTTGLMLLFAVISTPIAMWVRPPDYPPNILFGLAHGASLVMLCMVITNKERHIAWRILAGITLPLWFVLAGWPAEFGYPVPGTVLLSYLMWRTQAWQARLFVLLLVIGSVYTFALINGNHYGLLSLPVLLMAASMQWPIAKRMHKLFFYILYPAHLLIFGIISMKIAAA